MPGTLTAYSLMQTSIYISIQSTHKWHRQSQLGGNSHCLAVLSDRQKHMHPEQCWMNELIWILRLLSPLIPSLFRYLRSSVAAKH